MSEIRQVFVDDSGRRRRLTGLAGVMVALGCVSYLGAVGLGLSESGVGPLLPVPARGNGLVAGFGAVPAGIPGLLAAGALGKVLQHPVPRPHRVLPAPHAAELASSHGSEQGSSHGTEQASSHGAQPASHATGKSSGRTAHA